MDQRDLPLLTVAELAPHLEKQDVSPVEVVEAYLERIERLEVLPALSQIVGPQKLLEAIEVREDALR